MATSCREEFTYFWKSESPFSQWHKSKFTMDGITYNCAEQCMMHQKALLFEDNKTADLIMKEKSPRKQKDLGRKVKNFDEGLWQSQCEEIVKQANMAKFSQNPDLLAELMSTRGTTLVEASPFDRIWGIGLTADSPCAWDRNTWEGTNLLGYILTEVREQLDVEQLYMDTSGEQHELSREMNTTEQALAAGGLHETGNVSEEVMTTTDEQGTEEKVEFNESSNGEQITNNYKNTSELSLPPPNHQTAQKIKSAKTKERSKHKSENDGSTAGCRNNREEFTYFWKSESPFSQWHESIFAVNGITYNCAEQYMMLRKALLFEDYRSADLIMKEKSPRKQKALGRNVKNFCERLWTSQCHEIVKQANMAKFTQNPCLLAELMSTRGTTLVEASPFDRVWGIGLTADDPAAWNKDTWEGANQLGYILTHIREHLHAEQLHIGSGEEKHQLNHKIDQCKQDMAAGGLHETGNAREAVKTTTDEQKTNERVESKASSNAEGQQVTKNWQKNGGLSLPTPNHQIGSPTTRSKQRTFGQETDQKSKSGTSSKSSKLEYEKGCVVPAIVDNRRKFTYFWNSDSPFSQWHNCIFTVDGTTYNCTEQYMMHRKALLFEDQHTADLIMKEKRPLKQKSLGQRVKKTSDSLWISQRQEIVKQANIAKFSQNPDLLAKLMSTQGTTLVEASPRDQTWGIGLTADDPAAWNKDTWKGTNLLGYILTEVREQLAAEQLYVEAGGEEHQLNHEMHGTEQTVAAEGLQEIGNVSAEVLTTTDKLGTHVESSSNAKGKVTKHCQKTDALSSLPSREPQIVFPTTRSKQQRIGKETVQKMKSAKTNVRSKAQSKSDCLTTGCRNNRRDFTYFWKSESPFSQWHESIFTVEGITYNCAEQYMMHQKALLFGDYGTADLIMKETSPRKQKALGRKVNNFDERLWTSQCQEIVKQANMAKFSQNPRLLAKLKYTRGTTLVEASPLDHIWGIGLTADDSAAWNKDTWKGTNLLGYILTEVREQLAAEQLYMDTSGEQHQRNDEMHDTEQTVAAEGLQEIENISKEVVTTTDIQGTKEEKVESNASKDAEGQKVTKNRGLSQQLNCEMVETDEDKQTKEDRHILSNQHMITNLRENLPAGESMDNFTAEQSDEDDQNNQRVVAPLEKEDLDDQAQTDVAVSMSDDASTSSDVAIRSDQSVPDSHQIDKAENKLARDQSLTNEAPEMQDRCLAEDSVGLKQSIEDASLAEGSVRPQQTTEDDFLAEDNVGLHQKVGDESLAEDNVRPQQKVECECLADYSVGTQ